MYKGYKTVLVDTNIISAISRNENGTLTGFMNTFPPNEYIPCFTIYNLRELKQCDNGLPENAYERAIRLFSKYPCMLTHPYKNIVQMEIDDYHKQNGVDIFLIGFSPLGINFREWIKDFWEYKDMATIIQKEDSKVPGVVSAWNNAKNDNVKEEAPYKRQDELKDFEAGEVYIHLANYYKFNTLNIPFDGFDVTRFPGARMMVLSNQRKIYFRKSLIEPGDPRDSMISCAVPYVDAVCTENSQAEVYKLAKGRIPQMAKIDIKRMADLRIQ